MSKLTQSAKGWYEQRFIKNDNRVHKNCKFCDKDLWFPQCQANKRNTCGRECSDKLSASIKNKRMVECLCCKEKFIPRINQLKNGGGKFCSISCSAKHNGQLWTKTARVKAVNNLLNSIKNGSFVPAKGHLHKQWLGGSLESRKRRSVSLYEYTKKYRKLNPNKVREFSSRRKSRKIGRLQNGTVEKIGFLQKWKCVICYCDIREKYHVDHIYPISKGGEHSPQNIQLLCPSCNVRKSAKDPIQYMQSMGFLL